MLNSIPYKVLSTYGVICGGFSHRSNGPGFPVQQSSGPILSDVEKAALVLTTGGTGVPTYAFSYDGTSDFVSFCADAQFVIPLTTPQTIWYKTTCTPGALYLLGYTLNLWWSVPRLPSSVHAVSC